MRTLYCPSAPPHPLLSVCVPAWMRRPDSCTFLSSLLLSGVSYANRAGPGCPAFSKGVGAPCYLGKIQLPPPMEPVLQRALRLPVFRGANKPLIPLYFAGRV